MALLLSPVATELPETMNALIWVRQGKERLALANSSGAMMIQATVPRRSVYSSPRLFDAPLALAAGMTTLAIVYLLLRQRRLTACKFSFALCGYVAFATAFQSATATVTLAPGTYTFWCPVSNHRDCGMEGTLTVARCAGGACRWV
jgi:Ca2+/Na+ antiporter